MCLFPAAFILVGLTAVATADEFRTGKDVTQGQISFILWATIIFAVLGILCK